MARQLHACKEKYHQVDPEQAPGGNPGVQFPDPVQHRCPHFFFLSCVLFSPFPPLKPVVSTWGNWHPVFCLQLFLCPGISDLCRTVFPFQGRPPAAKQVQQIGGKKKKKETGPATPSLGSLTSKKDRPKKPNTLASLQVSGPALPKSYIVKPGSVSHQLWTIFPCS